MIKKIYLLPSLSIRKFKKNRHLFGGLLHTEKKYIEKRVWMTSRSRREIKLQSRMPFHEHKQNRTMCVKSLSTAQHNTALQNKGERKKSATWFTPLSRSGMLFHC